MEAIKTTLKLPVDIGKDVELVCRSIKNQFFFFLKNKNTGLSAWFCLDSIDSEKEMTRKIMKSLEAIESGFMNNFTLKGVGYKASTENGFLKLRVGDCHVQRFHVPKNPGVSRPD